MIHVVRLSAAIALALLSPLLVSCGDDAGGGGGGEPTGGAAPGEACEMAEPRLCQDGYSLCFAVGLDSSCASGGLCSGDSNGMTCAFPCSSDTDCAAQSATAVCFVDCLEPLFDGQCVEPAVGDALLSFPFCDTPDSPRRAVSGSSP